MRDLEIKNMATYKKRGYKQPKEKVKEVAEELLDDSGYVEGESTTEEVFDTLDATANKAEEWFATNQKYIFGVVGVLALGMLAYMAFGKFVQEPKEATAANDMYQAQTYFTQAVNATGTAKDSLFNLALSGGEGKFGLVDITNEYSGTDAANLATYMAGMSYLNMNDYENAVSYLDKFSSKDEVFSANAKGGVADAFVQLNQLEDALGYYEQAAKVGNNEFTAPKFLYKAAVVALDLGKKDVAAKHLNRIKDEFKTSVEATKVDALLGQAQAGK